MPQLHCYVPDTIAQQVKNKAKHAHVPVSQYLALLLKKDIKNEWPEHYFDIFGSFANDPLKRPDQGELEIRDKL